MRVVLDSNIVVSSYIVPLGAPARIVAAWRRDEFVLVVSPWLLAEYEHSLNYPRVMRRHRLTPELLEQDIATIRELAVLVEQQACPLLCRTTPTMTMCWQQRSPVRRISS
jgi:putative PIN family toxin of toxin-antitoxin system